MNIDYSAIAQARRLAKDYNFEILLAAYVIANIEQAKDFVVDMILDDVEMQPTKQLLVEQATIFATEVNPLMLSEESAPNISEFIEQYARELINNVDSFQQVNIRLR